MRSLTNKTLVLLCSGGLGAALLCAVAVFFISNHDERQQSLGSVVRYAELIASREATRLQRVENEIEKTHQQFLTSANAFASDAPLSAADNEVFELLFPIAPDGTRRSIDALFDGMVLPNGDYVYGFSAYIRDGSGITNQRKRMLLSAFHTMKKQASGADDAIDNLFYATNTTEILAFAPFFPEAMLFYRRYAPPGINVMERGFVFPLRGSFLENRAVACGDLFRIGQGRANGYPSITCQIPFYTNGEPTGVIGKVLTPSALYGSQYRHAVPEFDVFLLSRNDIYLTKPQQALTEQVNVIGQPSTVMEALSANWLDRVLEAPGKTPDSLVSNDGRIFGVVRTLPVTGWKVVAGYSSADAIFEAFEAASRVLFAGGLMTVIVALLVSLSLRHGVSRPLNALSAQSRRVADALSKDADIVNAMTDLPTHRKDEIGALSRNFEALGNTALEARNGLKDIVSSRTAMLTSQTRAAHEAHAEKAELITKMSHGLRTPLNAVIGFAELLQTDLPGDMPKQKRQQLELLRDNACHMSALLDEVFDTPRPSEDLEDEGDASPQSKPGRIATDEV
ncbi:MAG: histidine kinase dimerization/phospho-acceptor domain-containing protein [Sphingomonadales bacterium]